MTARRVRGLLVGATLLSSVWTVAAAPACIAAGEGANEASVLIDTGDEVTRYCVSFDGTLSGLEALQRTGALLRLEDHGAGAVTVCAIDEVGCRYPEADCFCRFGDDAVFWGYYRDDGAGWRFSDVGASDSVVVDGSIEAWRYGPHTEDGGNAPSVAAGSLPCARATGSVGPDAVSRSTAALAGVFVAMILILVIGRFVRRRMEDEA